MECVYLRLDWQVLLRPRIGTFDVELRAKGFKPLKGFLLIRPCAVLWYRALDHDVAVCMEFVTPVVRFLLWETS